MKPTIYKIRGADPVDVDGDLAELFKDQGLSEPEDDMHLAEVPTEGVVVAKEPSDFIDFSSDSEVVAVLEFGKEPAVNLCSLETVAKGPLHNWTSFQGPVL